MTTCSVHQNWCQSPSRLHTRCITLSISCCSCTCRQQHRVALQMPLAQSLGCWGPNSPALYTGLQAPQAKHTQQHHWPCLQQSGVLPHCSHEHTLHWFGKGLQLITWAAAWLSAAHPGAHDGHHACTLRRMRPVALSRSHDRR
jgi:hypothetical protein